MAMNDNVRTYLQLSKHHDEDTAVYRGLEVLFCDNVLNSLERQALDGYGLETIVLMEYTHTKRTLHCKPQVIGSAPFSLLV